MGADQICRHSRVLVRDPHRFDRRVRELHRPAERGHLGVEAVDQPRVDRCAVDRVVRDPVVAGRVEIGLSGARLVPGRFRILRLAGEAIRRRAPCVEEGVVVAVAHPVGDCGDLTDVGAAVRSEAERPRAELLV
jgi:hypothetical protein